MPNETPSLVKPFSATVNANGVAVVDVSHSIHGLGWQILQIGFSLGQGAQSPEVSALYNGVPFVSTLVMSNSPFANIPGRAPVSMTAQFSGPPYPMLEAGDILTLGVLGANSGDSFVVACYINEMESPASVAARNAAGQHSAAYIPRSGNRRW